VSCPLRRPFLASGVLALALCTAAAAEPLVAGHLLVVTDLGQLASVDPATGVATPFASLPNAAGSRLAFDAAGDVLVRDGATGALLRVDAATAEVTPLAEGDLLAGSSRIAVGVVPDGADVLVTAQVGAAPDPIVGRVVRVAPGGGQTLVSDGPWQPTAIAIEAGGTILVTSRSFVLDATAYPDGGLLRIDPGTGDETVLSSGQLLESEPIDLEVLGSGTIAVLDAVGVLLVDPVTGVQTALPAPTTFDPDIDIEILTGFTTDGGTGYYLTTGHDVVDEVYPGGVVRVIPGGAATSTTGPSEFTTPVDVAVVPVPEPSLPALLAAGACVLIAAGAARRRRAGSSIGLALGVLAISAAARSAPLVPGHLVVLTDLGEVWTIDPATGDADKFKQLPNAVGGLLAFDGDGNLLARNRYSGAVLRIDAESAEVTTVAEGGLLAESFGASTGVAFDGADVLATAYVTAASTPPASGRIVRIDAAGEQHLVAAVGGVALDVAVEADGAVLVLFENGFVLDGEFHAGGMIRIDPATGTQSIVTADGYFEGFATDLEVAADGTIQALVDFDIVSVDPTTGVQSLAPPATSFDPDLPGQGFLPLRACALAADGADGFYVAFGHYVFDEFYPGEVIHFVPGGHVSLKTDLSAFTSPFDVAVVPLPEPEGWLMLAAGAVVLLSRGRPPVV
jgi:sugar lactone lactonase YvrE